MTAQKPVSREPGRLRRLIDLRCERADTVVGWLEDDFHHFGMSLQHDGNRVTDVRAVTLRYPWSTCPGAVEPVRALIGQRLLSRASGIGRVLEMRLQCTHLFDLAGLTLAHAASQRKHRRYEALVEDPEILAWDEVRGRPSLLGPSTAVLFRDGGEVLRWVCQNQRITGPPKYAGQSLQRGFREWTQALPEQESEYATVLRRALMVSTGRLIDMSQYPTAESIGMAAVCHSYQPERTKQATNFSHLQKDYAQSAAGMLSRLDVIP